MRRILFIFMAAVGMIFTSAAVGAGEEPKVETKPEGAATNLSNIKDILGLSIYLQGGYTGQQNVPGTARGDFKWETSSLLL